MRTGTINSKAKQSRDITTATTAGLVKEVRSSLTVGVNRTCSNRRNEKNKCSSKESREVNGTTKKGFLCNGCG